MITQRVKLDVNNQQGPTIYARMGEKNLRQIVFILTRKDEESGEDIAVDIPSGAVGQLRILKPSNNFVIVDLVKSTLESGSVIFTVTLPEQAVTVGGLCYYDVRIEETTSKFLFSVTGHMVVDDSVISSGVLEDVSEVNGVVFPDDFYTKDDHVAIIDDDTVSANTTWSSEKISNQIDIIDDNAVSTDTTWSSDKILDEIEINSGKHHYSTTEQIVGTWIDGSTVYEKTLYLASGQINESTSLAMPTQSDIERLIFYDGSVYDVNDQRYYAIPYERISAIEGIWLQCHVLSDHTLTPLLFTRQTQTYSLANIYVTIRYTKAGD